MIALSVITLNAQTVGTFADTSLSTVQRIEIANTIIQTGTDSEQIIVNAAGFMLSARPVVHLLTLFPNFADQVIADPTLGNKVTSTTQQDILKYFAYNWKSVNIANIDERISFLESKKSEISTTRLNYRLADLYATKINDLVVEKKYTEVESYINNINYVNYNTILSIFNFKLATRSSDVLSWAKLVYVVTPFNNSQSGINAVTKALRALDGGITRSNLFIKFQDGVGTNPIADVELPSLSKYGIFLANVKDNVANYIVNNDNISALKYVVSVFAVSAPGDQMNAAISNIAMILRNIDMNLVRANQYVDAQKNNTTFDIIELK